MHLKDLICCPVDCIFVCPWLLALHLLLLYVLPCTYLSNHYTHIVLSRFLSVPWGISYARPKQPKFLCLYAYAVHPSYWREVTIALNAMSLSHPNRMAYWAKFGISYVPCLFIFTVRAIHVDSSMHLIIPTCLLTILQIPILFIAGDSSRILQSDHCMFTCSVVVLKVSDSCLFLSVL